MIERDPGDIMLGCAMKTRSALGPGLAESAYEVCLAHELSKAELPVQKQVALPVVYDDVRLDGGFRIDLRIILGLNASAKLLVIHKAQLLSYLKLRKNTLEYLLNFNVVHMRDAIRLVVNSL